MGYHHYVCPKCKKGIKVPHTCKSRFYSSCGKKATDDWIKTKFNTLPDTTWQHITFTMPEQLWTFFWINRYLMNKAPTDSCKYNKTTIKTKWFHPRYLFSCPHFRTRLKKKLPLAPLYYTRRTISIF